MYKYALILALGSLATCEERPHKTQYVDPFALIDKHLSHSLAYHYLWPWGQLIKAAAALDLEESLENPEIISDSDKYQINLNVRRFKPDELKIKVKNRYIIVEGRQKVDGNNKFVANHFAQRFILPPGTKQEEVKAVLNAKGVLTILAPKHELPPPLPERDIPIEVILPEEKPLEKPQEKPEQPSENDEFKEANVQTSSGSPLEHVEAEATTHVGKIRKKELKTTTKTAKDNEVNKGVDGNVLDYALIEADE